MEKKKIPLAVIGGPTASGKTELSVRLARFFDAEIVSADSMQIYKGMDIATAKPDESEMNGIVHHLIGFADVDHTYSVADYLKAARKCISDIDKREKKAFVVGGTGLYISSLVNNIEFENEEPGNLRSELKLEAQEHGGEFLLKKLETIDPEYAAKLHPNNIGRIIRGIEINVLTGKTMSEHNELSRSIQSPYDECIIAIGYRDRKILYERIDRRVDKMLERGLLDEARFFYSRLDSGKTAVQAIGYKELFPYIDGKISLDEAADNLKRATRRYAKRQLTWLNGDKRVQWLYADEGGIDGVYGQALKILGNFYFKATKD